MLGKEFDSIDNLQTRFYNNYKMMPEISMSATKIILLSLVIPMTILARLPLQVNKDHRRAIIASRKTCVEAVEEHRRYTDLDERKDVLSLALKSEMFDNEELINHMGNSVGAGHETTAFQIAFTCYFMGKHLDLQDRLCSELPGTLPCPTVFEQTIDSRL